jgi:hypothetical protein
MQLNEHSAWQAISLASVVLARQLTVLISSSYCEEQSALIV